MIAAVGLRLAALVATSLALVAALPLRAEPAPAGCTGPQSAHWVSIAVEGLRNSNGVVALTLYPDDPSRFLKPKGSLYVTKVNARAGLAQACIFVPKPGAYAIALYHDENANGKFDRSGLGLPVEGFGFSNNPATIMSLPSFGSVRLAIPKPGLVSRIHMKYP